MISSPAIRNKKIVALAGDAADVLGELPLPREDVLELLFEDGRVDVEGSFQRIAHSLARNECIDIEVGALIPGVCHGGFPLDSRAAPKVCVAADGTIECVPQPWQGRRDLRGEAAHQKQPRDRVTLERHRELLAGLAAKQRPVVRQVAHAQKDRETRFRADIDRGDAVSDRVLRTVSLAMYSASRKSTPTSASTRA